MASAAQDRAERRAAKQERRATRRGARQLQRLERQASGPAPWLRELGLMASRAVFRAAELDLADGAERQAEAIEQVSEELDRILTWNWLGPLGPLAELLDGPLCDLIARAAVSSAYQAMRAEQRRAA